MSALHDPIFMTFQGDPCGGRSPAVMRVHSDNPLTEFQAQGARTEFNRFNAAARLSVAKFHSHETKLQDGTILRTTVINDRTVMDVYTGAQASTELDVLWHGFGVVAQGKTRCIYGKVDGAWKVTKLNPDQLTTVGSATAYSTKEVPASIGIKVRPHLVTGSSYWEFEQFKLPALPGGVAVSFTPTYSISGKTYDAMTDFIGPNNGVYDMLGVLKVIAPTPTAILPSDAEPVRALPPDVTADENFAVLQAYRRANVSPSSGIYMYRYAASIVSRASNVAYRVKTSAGVWITSIDFSSGVPHTIDSVWYVTPLANPTVALASAGGVGCGVGLAAISGNGYTIEFDRHVSSTYDVKKYAQIVGLGGTSGKAIHGWRYEQTSLGYMAYGAWNTGGRTELEHLSALVYTRHKYYERETDSLGGTRGGYYDARIERAPLPEEITPFTWGAAGGRNDITPLTLVSNVSYPAVRIFFRNGNDNINAYAPGPEDPTMYWHSQTLRCINSEHWVKATPAVEMPITWRVEAKRMFGGTAEGTMVGRYRHMQGLISTRYYEGDIPSVEEYGAPTVGGDWDDPDAHFPGVAVGVIYTVHMDNYESWMSLYNMNDDMNAWHASKYPLGTGGYAGPPVPNPEWADYDPNSLSPEVVFQLCVNKVNYDLESFYITDFDMNARFMAGIRVSVKCEGYEWRSASAYDPSILVQHTPATYTVVIEFISEWMPDNGGAGIDVTKELFRTVCTRPSFEFSPITNVNPWDITGSTEITFKMPPNVQLPVEFYSQMTNIMTSQGKNPCFAGSTNPDSWKSSGMFSTKGIEQSTATTRSLSKYPHGMLYARELKLSDYPDAFWLLDATKCNAYENNNPESPYGDYFYMRSLGDRIRSSQVTDIQLRDGVEVNWVDELGADSRNDTLPSGMKKVNLYRI